MKGQIEALQEEAHVSLPPQCPCTLPTCRSLTYSCSHTPALLVNRLHGVTSAPAPLRPLGLCVSSSLRITSHDELSGTTGVGMCTFRLELEMRSM